jgi:hypothetical protein
MDDAQKHFFGFLDFWMFFYWRSFAKKRNKKEKKENEVFLKVRNFFLLKITRSLYLVSIYL